MNKPFVEYFRIGETNVQPANEYGTWYGSHDYLIIACYVLPVSLPLYKCRNRTGHSRGKPCKITAAGYPAGQAKLRV